VKDAKFHIYSVKTISEGIELLTGMNCGKREPDGNFTEGSVFRKVQLKLEKYNKSIEAAQAAIDRYGNGSSDEYDLE
jgi:hypothetical protein